MLNKQTTALGICHRITCTVTILLFHGYYNLYIFVRLISPHIKPGTLHWVKILVGLQGPKSCGE